VPSNQTVGSNDIGQGVIEWEEESFNATDLALFASNVSIPLDAVPKSQIVGPNNPSFPGGESTLDIEMVAGVAPANSNWFWLEQDDAWLYGFTVHFVNTTKAPDVSSISYSWYEGDQCEDGIGGLECKALGNVTSAAYVHRVNVEWQKVGLLGRSIVISSGDSGAHTRFDGGCQSPYLLAEFPPSSPYVTAVGATEVQNETLFDSSIAPACSLGAPFNFTCVSGGLEVAVDVQRAYFTSGGGFSNISFQPAYQRDAVAAYLADSSVTLPPASMYNAKGRAYPDVAANGHNAFVITGGYPGLTGGTSQSSPIFAAVAALLNAEFKKITGAPFGFLNPILYKMAAEAPETFTDITSGDNVCTEEGCAKSCKGWYTAKGWDPVTGLGTPNYPAMLAYVQKLGEKVVRERAERAQAAKVASA